MKTGLEDKKKVAVLAALLLVMVGAVVYFVKAVFIGGSSAPPPVTTAVERPVVTRQAQPAASAEAGPEAPKIPALASLDPTLHPEIMAGAESLEYTGAGRNIFSMSSAPAKIEAVKGPVRPAAQEVAQKPQGPPPPPPIDLKFFGYEAQGSARKAFLLHGDDVFIATEGEVVDHHYKVIKINPLSIQVTDLLYNNTQTLPLTQS